MKTFWLFLFVFLAMIAGADHAAAQVRMSFGGHSLPVGSFDETTDPTLYISLSEMVGPPHLDGSNSIWYLNLFSKAHSLHGYLVLADTTPFYLCEQELCSGCSYDLTMWMEPGHVIAGHLTQGDQNAHLHGNEWQGHVPTDFTSMRLEFVSHSLDGDCTREIVVPIVWLESPVPTQQATWGSIKALYQ